MPKIQVHDDGPCKNGEKLTPLVDGHCPACGYHPDSQSTAFMEVKDPQPLMKPGDPVCWVEARGMTLRRKEGILVGLGDPFSTVRVGKRERLVDTASLKPGDAKPLLDLVNKLAQP